MTYALDEALIATPIGMVRICGNAAALDRISLERGGAKPLTGKAHAVREATAQIQAYFAGTLRDFDLPLVPVNSERGQILREGIVAVGYGDAMSYGALARMLGSGPRAVGQACARNPYPLVVPCHRILAAGGRLGAYTTGEGPKTKQWLLDHEARYA